MQTVECRVVIFDRGRDRETVVPVEEDAIHAKCWRPIAALKAAVYLDMPFQDVLERGRYGFHKADKERLFGKTGERIATAPPGPRNDNEREGPSSVTAEAVTPSPSGEGPQDENEEETQ